MKNTIVGIAGPAGSGKDTMASVFNARAEGALHVVSFADAIKKGCASLLGIDEQYFYDAKHKEALLPDFLFSPREFMQVVGTEVCRTFDPDIWVKLLDKTIAAKQASTGANYAGSIIPDVRFENEAQYVRERGTLVFIDREVPPVGIEGHASEKGLVPKAGDIVVSNKGTLQDFFTIIEDTYELIFILSVNKGG